MSNVRTDMTVSLDGYICGLAAQQPPYLDKGFFRITEWAIEHQAWRERAGFDGGLQGGDDALLKEMFAQAGAYVMGRRMFDSGEEPWGESPPFRAPVFVVTHRAREPLIRKDGTTFHFVTDGLEYAPGKVTALETLWGTTAVNIWNARRAAVLKWLTWCRERGWNPPTIASTAGRPPRRTPMPRSARAPRSIRSSPAATFTSMRRPSGGCSTKPAPAQKICSRSTSKTSASSDRSCAMESKGAKPRTRRRRAAPHRR